MTLVDYRFDGGAARLTLARADRGNALDVPTAASPGRCVEEPAGSRSAQVAAKQPPVFPSSRP